ncbi:MAG: hypothetical protein AAFV33_11350 [Chloroflexota bacterium]
MTSTPQPHIQQQLAEVVRHCEGLIGRDDRNERTVAALVFVMEHPATDAVTRDRAEDLFLDLEAELCPRVIYDGREHARELLQGVAFTVPQRLLP